MLSQRTKGQEAMRVSNEWAPSQRLGFILAAFYKVCNELIKLASWLTHPQNVQEPKVEPRRKGLHFMIPYLVP